MALRTVLVALSAFFLALAVLWQHFVLCPIRVTPVDLSGKTIVVTGGTSGIGKETVFLLASWNATVIMAARDQAKAERVRAELLSRLPVGSIGTLECWELDLASLASVRHFAFEFRKTERPLHVLINNAAVGALAGPLQLSQDEIELAFQTNHLGHFLLTLLLLPVMDRSVPARIVHVSSVMHYFGKLDREAYSRRNIGSSGTAMRAHVHAYSDTKLFQVLFSAELDSRLAREAAKRGNLSRVTSNVVHPGFVLTDLDRGLPVGWKRDLSKLIRQKVARSAFDGALTSVAIATELSLNNIGGRYFEDRCVSYLCVGCLFCQAEVEKAVVGTKVRTSSRSVGGVVMHSAAGDSEDRKWLWDTSALLTHFDETFSTV
eukprot:gb/GEZN01011190.1/.p1 GENE.gb/GEZN01011190.1/~~gb/GEZN01011190.1/.p1  ORF type:complete len:375 (+),score=33.27 gb/GEZN01011190.1/:43-1167(+)